MTTTDTLDAIRTALGATVRDDEKLEAIREIVEEATGWQPVERDNCTDCDEHGLVDEGGACAPCAGYPDRDTKAMRQALRDWQDQSHDCDQCTGDRGCFCDHKPYCTCAHHS